MTTLSDPSTATDCCAEYAGLSRRGLLRAGALVAATGAVTSAFGTTLTQTAYAATRSAPRTLVLLSLRGAADGMSLVVPHADPVYYSARPRTAVPKASLLEADAQFGLHPALAPLQPMWRQGRVAAVHAVGLPAPNRSHFAAMEEVEDADPGSSVRVGWLNRLIGRDPYAHPLRGVHLGGTVPPTAFVGPRDTFAARSADKVELSGADDSPEGRRRTQALQATWASAPGPLGRGARAALTAVGDFGAGVDAVAAGPRNGAAYPDSDLGQALASTARTIRADVGAEVVTVDHGSWDMHTNVGNLDGGDMLRKATDLAGSLAAFFTDLGPALGERVTVVTVSEFGRRVRENASWGLDHGHGTVMLALGGGVRGGYVGRWPGLVDTADADLPVTTDFRSVLAELVTTRFGASSAQVFPGFTPEAVGVFRA